ncbi:chemotaxis protein CheE, partial [Phenylobacterium sp.]|uniref:chemotaxis protein CheE n=1 Tax=Phenylobacterium sp. TaxID=1871053 RepID=UPI00286E5C09
CLEAIDTHMAEIERRFGTGASGRAAEPFEDLYTLSSRIIDVGMGLPESGIDDGARAICEMVARSRARGALDWASVDVHLAALKLLRSSGQKLTAAQRASVLSGLGNVLTKRVGDADEAASG